MARKTGNRVTCKEVGNQNRNHETLPDEITLRDEIFELKRQMMVLKRTNEQYLVKLRKYEDEAKRKDKQVEQLMDPRKNADVTKVLSTKGAAILMNLKDQNNALIQMILHKDLHIRRLAAEIKMSKLYATTRKNECYRAEINRLRNLLMKSQEALKENVDVQERSMCAGGNSVLEFSSSSDQSSPRDLDELRATILSLESHVQHSNDLLAKKNQEISTLTNEVNFLRKCFRYKIYKNKAFDCDADEYKKHRFSTADFHKWSKPSTNQNAPDLFEKNQEYENLPHSAPAAYSKSFSSIDSTPKCSFQSPVFGREKEIRTQSTELAVTIKTNQEVLENALGKSQNLAVNELVKVAKTPSNPRKMFNTKEKWMKALHKYRELKKAKRQILTVTDQNESDWTKVEIVKASELLNVEAADLEMPKTVTQNQHFVEELENLETSKEEAIENLISGIPNSMNIDAGGNNERPNTCQNSESFSNLNRNEDCFDVAVWNDESRRIETEDEKELKHSTEKFSKNSNSSSYTEEAETFRIKSLREIYRQSLDSSFDSESSSSTKQEVRQVEVEVQINSVSLQNDSDPLGNNISENNSIFEGGGNAAHELDFNDDDDVIVREK